MRRAVAIVDGEHYPPVVRQALEELEDLVVAAVLVGGTEKLRGGEDYGVPVEPSVESAVLEHAPEVVIDLSDEPVLSPPERFALASRVLALGVPYEGPDFRFEPPRFDPIGLPAVAVIGTGKRVGKTAVTGHVARRLAATRRLVVVAMGRGGPAEPEVVTVPPTIDSLPRRTTWRRRSPRRCRRWDVAGAEAGSPARWGHRTSSRASRWPRRSTPSS